MASKIIYGTVGILTAIVLIYYFAISAPGFDPSQYTQTALNCTQKLQIKCGVGITKAVKHCSAAFAQQGLDTRADISCVKQILQDQKQCHPCICRIEQRKGWKVHGC